MVNYFYYRNLLWLITMIDTDNYKHDWHIILQTWCMQCYRQILDLHSLYHFGSNRLDQSDECCTECVCIKFSIYQEYKVVQVDVKDIFLIKDIFKGTWDVPRFYQNHEILSKWKARQRVPSYIIFKLLSKNTKFFNLQLLYYYQYYKSYGRRFYAFHGETFF